MINLSIPVEPLAKGRPKSSIRNNRIIVYTPKKTRESEKAIKDYTRLMMGNRKPLQCATIIEVIFYLKRGKSVKREVPCVKPDYDNLAKILDACNDILWLDDALIVDSHIYKRYSDGKEGNIKLKVYEYKPDISLIRYF